GERFGHQHPARAEAIVDVAVQRGHVNDWQISERLAEGVFRGCDAFADGVHDHGGEGGVTGPDEERVNENADFVDEWSTHFISRPMSGSPSPPRARSWLSASRRISGFFSGDLWPISPSHRNAG